VDLVQDGVDSGFLLFGEEIEVVRLVPGVHGLSLPEFVPRFALHDQDLQAARHGSAPPTRRTAAAGDLLWIVWRSLREDSERNARTSSRRSSR
jgi:hypothetical protein